jgi:Xaa-Pro aminopeptidase
MKYVPIDPKLFIDNRKKLVSKLKPNAIAIFNSNDIMPTNADGTMLFRQNNDLFYFSGIDQEESILIIFPNAPKDEWKEILFLRETSETIAIWEGNKLNKEQAEKASGIKTIYWLRDLDAVLPQLIFEAEYIYLNSNEHVRATNSVQTRESRFVDQIKHTYPLHKLERLAPIMNSLRTIKHDVEVELIRKAIEITEKAFLRTLSFIKPGVTEYQVEAEITHEFLWNRATRHAYTPIIACGASACILHYNDNNQPLKDGDLVLMDFGAEYANYAADLTRTVPVNGTFTPRQKDVYNAVHLIHNQARKLLIMGNNFEKYNEAVGKIVEEELIKLGLFTRNTLCMALLITSV